MCVGLSAPRAATLRRQRRGAFVAYFDSAPENNGIPDVLLPDPDRLFAAGETIQSPWQSAATDKVVVRVGDRDCFFKRYNCLGGGYRLKNIIRDSRALKSWWAGWKFLELGLPTPRPIVCLEERRFRLLGRSYLLLERIDGARSLLDAWSGFTSEQRQDLLVSLGATIGGMHRSGLVHGDLNWRNILVRQTLSGLEIFLVDLDGCRFFKRISRAMAQRDMGHFFRDLQRNSATDAERRIFTQAWEEGFLTS